jgi:hypothetical protein
MANPILAAILSFFINGCIFTVGILGILVLIFEIYAAYDA